MGQIIVSWSGNGTAYVDDTMPEPNQLVTLYCVPDSGETLEDIVATDSGGYSIALDPTLTQQSFRYNSAWGTVLINVYFSGAPTPPTPTSNWLPVVLKKMTENRTRI